MKCQRIKGLDIPGHCVAPVACGAFGFCRERLWDHNGMEILDPAVRAAWKIMDNPSEQDK